MKRRPIHCTVAELKIGDKVYLFDNLIYCLYDINVISSTDIEFVFRKYKGDKNTFTKTILNKDFILRRYSGKHKQSYMSGFNHAIALCIDYVNKNDRITIGIDSYSNSNLTMSKRLEKWMSNEK